MKNFFLSLLVFVSTAGYTQTIEIEFPKFAGKTYDFIIFQGDKQVKVCENDSLPKNGTVKLVIPKEYAPYRGMCRWLITNTAEGGGLDMAIPGYGFKVSCLSNQPDESNIKYIGFDPVNELNRLNKEQQTIINKFETMSKAILLYDKSHELYAVFNKEKELQIIAYDKFHQDLKNNSNYNARFLPIVNLVSGIPSKLTDVYEDRAKFVNEYIVNELDYDLLYTSGHWTGIIQSWVQMHTEMFQDKQKFIKDFAIVSNKITIPTKFTDWVEKVTYYLSQFTKDDFIDAIAPIVIASKKITSYQGKTMQVYVKAMIGSQAPDLILMEHLEKMEDHNHKTMVLQSKDFAQEGFSKTLLVFYNSGCGPCQDLMQQLLPNYQILKKNGIDVIAIASDTNEQIFKNTSANFPWQRTFCDSHGSEGQNFKNYAVVGTPTMFLIDKEGKIEKKISSPIELIK